MEPYGDRFESSWDLYALSERLLKAQQDDESTSRYENGDVLIWGIGTRSIKTYRAALYVAGLGHGPQAIILCRSLIEDALTATWATANRDEALRLMDLHERHTAHLHRTRFIERNLDLGELADLPSIGPEDLKEMNETFNKFGTNHWTGHRNLRELYDAVRVEWGTPNETHLLDHIIKVDLPYANQLVHNTASSLIRAQTVGEREVYDSGENFDHIPGSLLLAFWAFAHSVKRMLRAPYLGELESFYVARMPMFFRA